MNACIIDMYKGTWFVFNKNRINMLVGIMAFGVGSVWIYVDSVSPTYSVQHLCKILY